MNTLTAAAERRRWVALALLASAQLILVLDVTVVNVALPDIGAGLHLSRDALPWAMTTYTLFFGGLMLLGGRLADVLGARRTALTGLAVFTASSLLCGSAHSAATLLTGRALQGIGAALLSPAALSTVISLFPDAARTKAMGIWSGISGAGAALGVVLGGIVTSVAGWRWIFTINVPVGAALLIAIPMFTARTPAVPRGPGRSLDVPGALLVTAGTAAAIYALVNAGGHGWSAASTLLSLAAAVVSWVALAVVERTAVRPLLTVSLLTHRPSLAGSYLMLVATGLMVGGFFLSSFVLQRLHGYSAVHVGLLFLPAAVATILGAHTAGHLLQRVNARTVAVGGLALATIGYAAAAASQAATTTVVGLAVATLGIGAVFVTAFAAALPGAPPAEAGLRSALVNTFHELGGAAGVAVLSTAAGSALVATPAASGFAHGFTTGAVLAGVAMLAAFVVVPTVLRSPSAAPVH
jgi:EmrB/QacA subfamily drug resistance transporter